MHEVMFRTFMKLLEQNFLKMKFKKYIKSAQNC